MKKPLLALLLAAGLMGSVQAQFIDSGTPMPGSFALINLNGSGLDWVYAGPIGPNDWGPGNIQPASYRAAEGWRTATAAEWASRPSWSDFIVSGNPGNIVNPSSFSDHSTYIFASEYWSTFHHVDAADYANGAVTDGVNNVGGNYETIYVRNSIAPVPEPETYAMLLGGLGLIAAMTRRKRAHKRLAA